MCCPLKLHGFSPLRQVDKRVTTIAPTIEKQLVQKQAKRFNLASDAIAAALSLPNRCNFIVLKSVTPPLIKNMKNRDGLKKVKNHRSIKYQVLVGSSTDFETISRTIAAEGHYIIGGFTHPEELSDFDMVEAYKKQHHVVCSFRFLKDPCIDASSLFVKSPKRIMG